MLNHVESTKVGCQRWLTSANSRRPRPIDASELRQRASPALSWVLLPAESKPWPGLVIYSRLQYSTFCSTLNPKLSDKILCPSIASLSTMVSIISLRSTKKPSPHDWSVGNSTNSPSIKHAFPPTWKRLLRKFGRVSESLLEHRESSCRFYWGTQWWYELYSHESPAHFMEDIIFPIGYYIGELYYQTYPLVSSHRPWKSAVNGN